MIQSRVKTEKNTTMKCRDAELLMIDMLAGRKAVEQSDELSRHLMSCNACNRKLNFLGTGFRKLTSGRRVHPDPDFYFRLDTAIQQHGNNSREVLFPVRSIFRLSPAMITAAASVLIGIWIGGHLFHTILPGSAGNINLSDTERAGLMQLYAIDLHLEDENTMMLESYLLENDNSDNDGTE